MTTLRNILFAIHETVRTDDARQGLNWLREEVPGYFNQPPNDSPARWKMTMRVDCNK